VNFTATALRELAPTHVLMAATDAPREESAAKQPKNAGGGVHVTGLVLVAALVGMYVVDTYFKPSLPRASTKPFKTFEEFLPFYLSEHSDVWCRRVHFIGTTIALTFFLRYPTTILNAIAAASVGMCLMPLTAHLDLGLIEGGAMILTFFLLSRYTTGS